MSAEDGTFSITGLRSGKYSIASFHPYYLKDWSAGRHQVSTPAGEVEVRARATATLDITVE